MLGIYLSGKGFWGVLDDKQSPLFVSVFDGAGLLTDEFSGQLAHS